MVKKQADSHTENPVVKKLLQGDEESHQIAVVNWFELAFGFESQFLHHSPNGGWRAKKTASRMKQMGTRRGFPDLVLYQARGDFTGLVVEMKRLIVKGKSKGRLSDSQAFWLDHLQKQGFQCIIANGYDEAVKALSDFMKLPVKVL